jgi:hypothetical protein
MLESIGGEMADKKSKHPVLLAFNTHRKKTKQARPKNVFDLSKIRPELIKLAHSKSPIIVAVFVSKIINLFSEAELVTLVKFAAGNPKALAFVRANGAKGLIALYDSGNNINHAKKLLLVDGKYSTKTLNYRRRNRVVYNQFVAQAKQLITTREWNKLVQKRIADKSNHRAVIIKLIGLLQPKLQHSSGREIEGKPTRSNPKKIASDCHYTTKLIVNALIALGIPAKHETNKKIISPDNKNQYGHSYPYFPSIGEGLTHGDELYSTPLLPAAKLLVHLSHIKAYWKKQEVIFQREFAKLKKQFTAKGSAAQLKQKALLLQQSQTWATSYILTVPVGPGKTIPVTGAEVIKFLPAPFVMELGRKSLRVSVSDGWLKLFLAVRIPILVRYTKNPNHAMDIKYSFPPNFRNPNPRLPKNKKEALQLISYMLMINRARSKASRIAGNSSIPFHRRLKKK